MSGTEPVRLAAEVGVHLEVWSTRDEPGTDRAAARRAANDAVDAIDRLLSLTHQLRATLVGEVRRFDVDSAARVDELLERYRDQSGDAP